MSLKNPNLQPELQFLRWYCTPEKVYHFIFSTETPSKNMIFKKNLQVSITSKSKVMPVCVFNYDVIFAKLSKFGKFFVDLLQN